MSVTSFVSDIFEREPGSVGPPSAPILKSKDGFPAHKPRQIKAESRFKQQQQQHSFEEEGGNLARSSDVGKAKSVLDDAAAASLPASNAPLGAASDISRAEKEQIDSENQAVIAAMTKDEIEDARQELMASLNPNLLQRLLRRADIGTGSNESTGDLRAVKVNNETQLEQISTTNRRANLASVDEEGNQDDQSASHTLPDTTQQSIHFPRPEQPPDLDPTSETFLEDLHTKYFPSLPSDPDKLDWMRMTNTSKNNSYHPDKAALNPRDIRFSFRGELIPPSEAAQIPVTKGLHHHGDAPDAAGYTIPELAHLSRSTYAPQRCIAFQTLGRILYRLGKADFGDPGEPGGNTVGAEETMGELARGLWREVETQHVIEQLVAESEGHGIDGGRHVSAKAYATEAVWLWRRGGGRRWKAD